MKPLKAVLQYGQSIWLDYIRRSLITSGELKRLVEEEGVRGLTSNPTILELAIAESTDYDDALRIILEADPHTNAQALYERLALEDIQMAADILRPVYQASAGADGFVSLEVPPHLAHDTAGTIAEARRLWQAVGRPNLLVKVPSTAEGIPAIEALIAQGVNVNATLVFSLAHYQAVAQAYIRGLERCPDPRRVASVASFFVSRVDTAVDKVLQAIGSPEALALRGKIAIANTKKAYRHFREIFYGEPFAALQQRGAHLQRPVWASTSTKNPAYPDVLYVEELIGPDTVNTIPPTTLDAFRDHGRGRPTLLEGLEEAEGFLASLKKLGVDLDAITGQLQKDGVAAFAASYDQLLAALKAKRQAILIGQGNRQSLDLGANQTRVQERLQTWEEANFTKRLWHKDSTLWSPRPLPEIPERLGWLTLPEVMHQRLDSLTAFAEEVKAEGVSQVVLLGMGGSSLASEVLQLTFGNAPGYPRLTVLDSTHPAAVRAVEDEIDLRSTLFLVSSKSGTTPETLSLFRYLWHRASQVVSTPGRHFVAITDPGTPLEALARQRGFRRTFLGPADVGGRYSALTVFGLTPAALIGLDGRRLLDRAWLMANACAPSVPEVENPGLALGATLGELALAGRDKVTFLTSPGLAALADWLEQLIAESTGKDGRGIIPVVGEPLRPTNSYGPDRFFVYLHLQADGTSGLEEQLSSLKAAGHPVAYIYLENKADLGQEFFRWEVAVAAAGAVLGINPFNEPDVQLAKDLARKAMTQGGRQAGMAAGVAEVSTKQSKVLRQALKTWLARPGDYVALQAFLAPTPQTRDALQGLRQTLQERLRLATSLGFGPRFLHSTGQLHKGGPNTGLFLQLVDEPMEDLPVPETDYTFGALISAQALGDYQALVERGRRVLRVHLGRDVAAGLRKLRQELLR